MRVSSGVWDKDENSGELYKIVASLCHFWVFGFFFGSMAASGAALGGPSQSGIRRGVAAVVCNAAVAEAVLKVLPLATQTVCSEAG